MTINDSPFIARACREPNRSPGQNVALRQAQGITFWPFRHPQYCSIGFTIAAIAFSSPTIHALATNDPGYGQQWQLKTIGVESVWDERIDPSQHPLVAVIDTGVDIDHPDLRDAIVTNEKEVAENGIDDDQNGFIDDIHGWDFVAGAPDSRPKLDRTEDLERSPLGVHHGTILAGIIAAGRNNNQGVAGVASEARILPIRALESNGEGTVIAVARAIDYARQMRAHIINLSFVGFVNDPILAQAIDRAHAADILVVASAGNEVKERSESTAMVVDLDATPLYPVCHDGPNTTNAVLGVASTNREDRRSSFSSFGRNCIDLSAPGEEIIGTRATNPLFGPLREYGGTFHGTSMAAAYVSGAAALLKTLEPQRSMASIRRALVDGVDPLPETDPSQRGKLGAGRLNVARALTSLRSAPTTTVQPPPQLPPAPTVFSPAAQSPTPSPAPVAPSLPQPPERHQQRWITLERDPLLPTLTRFVERNDAGMILHTRLLKIAPRALYGFRVLNDHTIIITLRYQRSFEALHLTNNGTLIHRWALVNTKNQRWADIIILNDKTIATLQRSPKGLIFDTRSVDGSLERAVTLVIKLKGAQGFIPIVTRAKTNVVAALRMNARTIALIDARGAPVRSLPSLPLPKDQRIIVVASTGGIEPGTSLLAGEEYQRTNPLFWQLEAERILHQNSAILFIRLSPHARDP